MPRCYAAGVKKAPTRIGLGLLVLVTASAALWMLFESSAPDETPIVRIPLAGGAELPEAEISSLAWHGRSLVLLPQYPSRFAGTDGRGALFVLERDDIEAALDGAREEALEVRRVPLIAPDLEGAIPGFDGFEALTFAGSRVFVTVEARRGDDDTIGWLVPGRVEGALERVVLEPSARVRLRAQNDLTNIGYESLFVSGDRLYAIYETNGEVNPSPTVLVFDLEGRPLHELPMGRLEYRVTDATEVDGHGRFWVTNYHWPGALWQTASCELTEEYGEGASHARCRVVERLVEMIVTPEGVALTGRPPILLELLDDDHARNWEGLVHLPGRGFLVMTDEHPASILALVPAEL